MRTKTNFPPYYWNFSDYLPQYLPVLLHLNHKQWAIMSTLQSHKISGKYRINSDTSTHTAEEMPDSSLGLWLNDKDVTDVPLSGMKILQYAKRIIPTLLLLVTTSNHNFKQIYITIFRKAFAFRLLCLCIRAPYSGFQMMLIITPSSALTELCCCSKPTAVPQYTWTEFSSLNTNTLVRRVCQENLTPAHI